MTNESTKKASRAREARSKAKQHKGKVENGEKSGACRKLLLDIVTLRVLRYIFQQPPSCTFIVTLFVVAGCLPFIGVYISQTSVLPDLDAMMNWNAYLGKLGQRDFCFTVKKDKSDSSPLLNTSIVLPAYPPFNKTWKLAHSNWNMSVVCVELEFEVNRDFVVQKMEGKEDKVEEMLLVSNFTGSDIGTQIKANGSRIDEDGVFIHFWIEVTAENLNVAAQCTETKCRVNGSVLITAPSIAVPTRLPQVHKDFSFETKIVKSYNCCRSSPGEQSESSDNDKVGAPLLTLTTTVRHHLLSAPLVVVLRKMRGVHKHAHQPSPLIWVLWLEHTYSPSAKMGPVS